MEAGPGAYLSVRGGDNRLPESPVLGGIHRLSFLVGATAVQRACKVHGFMAPANVTRTDFFRFLLFFPPAVAHVHGGLGADDQDAIRKEIL